jgi:Lipopolysaccharide kinase (Kdo/WaaP) family
MGSHARFASDEIAKLFATSGLRDLEDAFRVGVPLGEQHLRRATRHQNKHVVKFGMDGPDGPTTVYIKRQWRRQRWVVRPTDIRHRINLQCSPVHEWRGLRILQEAGFSVSEPLALFWSGWGLARGAVVTRAVPPPSSLADMLHNGELDSMPAEHRRALIDAAVEVVADLQKARISWRSMKAKHFYPERFASGVWRIWLIDCEGVYRWASRRDCAREWQTFLGSFTSPGSALRGELLTAFGRALWGGDKNIKRSA